jgi:hypothetical protein
MLNNVVKVLSQPVVRLLEQGGTQSVERMLEHAGEDVFRKAPSFIAQLAPEQAVKLSFEEAIPLFQKLGAFHRGELTVEQVMQMTLRGEKVPSPVHHLTNSDWLKQAKIVGIHPRAIGTYPNMTKYAMTFPEETVHILPMLETGAGDSLYCAASWKFSREYLCPELVKKGFDTPEKQLLLTTNMLHALGKRVGFDAVPHMDRFAEPVLANPHLFEWIKIVPETGRDLPRILSTAELSHAEAARTVEETALQFLRQRGSASGKPLTPEHFDRDYFFRTLSEEERIAHLFGPAHDLSGRTARRVELMHQIRARQLETMPVVGDAPYGKVAVLGFEDAERQWYKFGVPADQKYYGKDVVMFSNVTGFRWFNRNADGTLAVPTSAMLNAGQDLRHLPAWDYFSNQIKQLQNQYGLDFVRADMAHMQIAHAHGRPVFELDPRNEFWRYMKETVQRDQRPSFGVLGEAFYSPQYVDAVRHCEALGADVVYGNMQYAPLQTGEFLARAKEYSLLGLNHPGVSHRPLFNVMTADSDKVGLKIDQLLEPKQRVVRYFYSLFGGNPGYMGMGFETRVNLLDKWKQLLAGNHQLTAEQLKQLLPQRNELLNKILNRDPYLGLTPQALEAMASDSEKTFLQKLEAHLLSRSQHDPGQIREALHQLKPLMEGEQDAMTERFINGRPWPGAPYRWGPVEAEVMGPMERIRHLYGRIKSRLNELNHWWLPVEGEQAASRKVGTWSFFHPETKIPEWLCVGNTDLHRPLTFQIPNPTSVITGATPRRLLVAPVLETASKPVLKRTVVRNGETLLLTNLPPGDCAVFRVLKSSRAD